MVDVPTLEGGWRSEQHRARLQQSAGSSGNNRKRRKERNVQGKMENQSKINQISTSHLHTSERFSSFPKSSLKKKPTGNIIIYFSQIVKHSPPTACSLVAMVTPRVCHVCSFTRSEIWWQTPVACNNRRISRALDAHIRHAFRLRSDLGGHLTWGVT